MTTQVFLYIKFVQAIAVYFVIFFLYVDHTKHGSFFLYKHRDIYRFIPVLSFYSYTSRKFITSSVSYSQMFVSWFPIFLLYLITILLFTVCCYNYISFFIMCVYSRPNGETCVSFSCSATVQKVQYSRTTFVYISLILASHSHRDSIPVHTSKFCEYLFTWVQDSPNPHLISSQDFRDSRILV